MNPEIAHILFWLELFIFRILFDFYIYVGRVIYTSDL